MAASAGTGGPWRLLRRLRDVMARPGAAQPKLDRLVRIIAADMVAEVCSCYLTRAGEVLELFATEGLNLSAVHHTRLEFGQGLIGTIAGSGRTLNLADAQAHPAFAYRPETGEEIYQSFLGVPIMHGGRVIGVLAVQNRTQRHYHEEEAEALQTIAMVIAELVASSGMVGAHELLGAPAVVTRSEVWDGLGLAAGLGMGVALIHEPPSFVRGVVAEDPAREGVRLVEAVAALQAHVDRMLEHPDMNGVGAHRDILETYRMFARDSGWLKRIEEAIHSGLTAEAAVTKVREDTHARMSHTSDPYFRERLQDLDDLAYRLLEHLSGGGTRVDTQNLSEDFVVVARALGPAEFLDYRHDRLRGLVLEEGSPTTHVAILARAFGLPVVGRIRDAVQRIDAGENLILNGVTGRVVARPSADVIHAFHQDLTTHGERRDLYHALRDKPVRTRDGVSLSLKINIGLGHELAQLAETSADGVGLYRTEIGFMLLPRFPSVDEQTAMYRGILQGAAGKPVVFRTLDIGGDKTLPYLPRTREENPAMGWRAIRIGLDRPAMLRHQLRALIRAADGNELRIMFPMIADVSEFDAARGLLDRELSRARGRGESAPKAVSVGVMIEVPALLLGLPFLLPKLDFISVGTNDLIQFLFASDRSNPRLANRYGTLSFAMLSVIRDLARQCREHEVALTVCGEAAGEPIEALGLIAVGVRELSMRANRIGAAKLMIRSVDMAAVAAFVESELARGSTNLKPALVDFARDHHIDI